MGSLSGLRHRLNAVRGTRELVSSMGLLAKAKLARLSRSGAYAEDYCRKVSELFQSFYSEDKKKAGPLRKYYVPESENGRLLVIISSDLGLAGSYNSEIFRFAESHLREGDEIAVYGKKGISHFSRRGYRVSAEIGGIHPKTNADIAALREYLLKGYLDGRYGEISFISSFAVNPLKAEARLTRLLPLDRPAAPAKKADVLFDEDPLAMFMRLLPVYLDSRINSLFLSSSYAEQTSRRAAMDQAKDNADDLIKNLNIEYNKARQGAITREITEVVGGYEAN